MYPLSTAVTSTDQTTWERAQDKGSSKVVTELEYDEFELCTLCLGQTRALIMEELGQRIKAEERPPAEVVAPATEQVQQLYDLQTEWDKLPDLVRFHVAAQVCLVAMTLWTFVWPDAAWMSWFLLILWIISSIAVPGEELLLAWQGRRRCPRQTEVGEILLGIRSIENFAHQRFLKDASNDELMSWFRWQVMASSVAVACVVCLYRTAERG